MLNYGIRYEYTPFYPARAGASGRRPSAHSLFRGRDCRRSLLTIPPFPPVP
jgi:hypothetical protein